MSNQLQGIEGRIREASDRAFNKHVITQELNQGLFRSWMCKQPDRTAYWFRIVTAPGYLIMMGDLGTLVVSREDDMIPFCRKAVNDTNYFAEKCQNTVTYEFSTEAVKEWIADQRRQLADHVGETETTVMLSQLNELSESLDGIDNWRDAIELVPDCYDSGEPPRWTDWNPQFLWRRDAIRWFIRTLDSQAAHTPETPKAAT